MKKIFYATILLASLSITTVIAQDSVRFVVSDGIGGDMKGKIEKSASELLTEINAAYIQERALNTAKLNLTPEARKGLASLWENVRFKCDDNEVVELCLHTKNGYQIRNIPLIIRSHENITTQDDEYQEGVINFDKNGYITRFNFAIAINVYQNIMKNGTTVEEIETLHQIIGYVEHFRTAYDERDLDFLKQVFSDDALIITGTVINVTRTDAAIKMPTRKVIYKKQTKTEYLKRLENIFNDPDLIEIKVDFDYGNLKVQKHPKYKDIYGVTVHQLYSSRKRKGNDYSDDGYVFMLWDFRNKNKPQIHVRTWQPKWLDDKKTEELPKKEIFKVGEFEGFEL